MQSRLKHPFIMSTFEMNFTSKKLRLRQKIHVISIAYIITYVLQIIEAFSILPSSGQFSNRLHRDQYKKSSFSPRKNFSTLRHEYIKKNKEHYVQNQFETIICMTGEDSDGWSMSAVVQNDLEPKKKRIGVRSRVRSVLSKAKKRTRFRNGVPEDASPQSVIADAASIGGLGAVLVDSNGTVDVALEYDLSDKKINSALDSRNKIKQIENGRKQSPASTYSPSTVRFELGPEILLRTANETNGTPLPITEVDAFNGDVSAAFSLPPPPLPFTLPTLTPEQKQQLDAGERVQFQSEMGRQGSGFVAVDVKAPPSVVWDCLLDFESYPDTIPTVRAAEITSTTNKKFSKEKNDNAMILRHGVSSDTSASFTLSKFRFRIAAVHKYRPHPQGDYMRCFLDPSSKNPIFQDAKCVWHTQRDVDGKKGITRVWLLAELKVSNFLPRWIVDYASARAFPRGTTWIKPQVEAAASLWLKQDSEVF